MPHSISDTWVMEIPIDPKSREGQKKMFAAIGVLIAEDASLGSHTDHESGQTILMGVGEDQLDVAITRLTEEFDIDLNVGAPTVRYRETISREVEINYTHRRRSRGEKEFAFVRLILSPDESDAGCRFENQADTSEVPEAFVSAVEAGIHSVLRSRPLAGFPVAGIRIKLIGGAFDPTESSTDSFEIAARCAMREGLRRGGRKLQEPIARVEIVASADCTQRVIGDLFTRRGVVQAEKMLGAKNTISALVPVSTMFGYTSTLLSATSGRGQFTMVFSHYQDVPPPIIDPDNPDTFPSDIGMHA